MRFKKKDCFLLQNSQVHKNALFQLCYSCSHSSEGLWSHEWHEHDADYVQILKPENSNPENVGVYCPKSGFLLTTLILTLFFIKNRFCCKRKMFKNKILNVTHNDYYDHDEAHQTTCSIIFQLCAEKIQIESAASIFMYIILF